jgi:hypothetical protein
MEARGSSRKHPIVQANKGNNGYLGLSFQINGETYYGWMALKVKFLYGGGYNVVETGYPYETVANTPINAGQTK